MAAADMADIYGKHKYPGFNSSFIIHLIAVVIGCD
jgi:hypothetical protein